MAARKTTRNGSADSPRNQMMAVIKERASDQMMALAQNRAAELRELVLKEPTAQETAKKEIISRLAELGGQMQSEDTLRRHDENYIAIPKAMSVPDAIQALEQYQDSQEEITHFMERMPFRPMDGAHAFQEVARQYFGFWAGKTVYSFWGPERPVMTTIPISPKETKQVPWGRVTVPILKGAYIDLEVAADEERGPVFQMSAECRKADQHVVQGFFHLVRDFLAKYSIYRGRAIDGREQPSFVDLEGVDESKIIYSQDTLWQLRANLWDLIEHTDRHVLHGLPLKRSVMLEGTFGTGKSEAAKITAKRCVEHGWTFIQVRPGDDLFLAMKTARLLEPAVVFFEDVDTITSSGGQSTNAMASILDLMDGIGAKHTKIVAVFTTNHIERLHKGMLRPGRLDALIHFGDLDTLGIEALIRVNVPAEALDANIDFAQIQQEMEGFTPAFSKEAIDRAKRYSLARNDGQLGLLDTEDFVLAARGLRPQHELMLESSDATAAPTMDTHLRHVAEQAVANVVKDNLLEPHGLVTKLAQRKALPKP